MMKKITSLLLTLLLCFSLIGCTNDKNVTNITKTFEDAGYSIKYSNDENTTVTISETINGKNTRQFIAYIEKNKVESIAYIKLPDENQSSEDMEIGFIYTDKNSDSQVNKSTKDAAIKVLDNFELSIDDLVKYVLEIHNDKGKSLSENN